MYEYVVGNITFYDKEGRPLAFIDDIIGDSMPIEENVISNILNKRITKDGQIKELDFSDIPDESWLLLKKCKKIVFDSCWKKKTVD